jgi:hypothetical protein
MNAAERLWAALAARDWPRALAQFLPNAVVEWPHSGARMEVGAYVGAMEVLLSTATVEIRRTAGEGHLVAVEAAIGAARCGGFYDLHEGRIRGATEYWVPGTVPGAGSG